MVLVIDKYGTVKTVLPTQITEKSKCPEPFSKETPNLLF
jgi:hypothetical protein